MRASFVHRVDDKHRMTARIERPVFAGLRSRCHVAAAVAVMRPGPAQGRLGRVKPQPDRLRDVVDAVIEALDEGLDGRAMAARAMLSPFHFNRLVRAGIGEPPAAFRRRLLLERAAWRLGRGASVIDAGLEAGYHASEALLRAVRPAYGVAQRSI